MKVKTIYTGYGSNKATKNYQKIYNFVKTERGHEFVSKLHMLPLSILAQRFSIPFILTFKNDKKNYKLIEKALIHTGVHVKPKLVPYIKPGIIDYTHITEIPSGTYPNLTKDEIKQIDNLRPSKKLGKAARFHALEQHKMDKWETKHPRPSEEQLKGDLFPQTLVEGYNQLYEAKQESIRNWIILKYCKNYLPVVGRWERFPGKYFEKIVGFVHDARNEVGKLTIFKGDIDDEPLNIVRKAYGVIQDFIKDDKFVCGKLCSRDGIHERFLIPGMDRYDPNRYGFSTMVHQYGEQRIVA